MHWNEHTKKLLEMNVFKGKIVGRREGRGGLVYIIEQDAHPKLIAYKTIKEFEGNIPVDSKRFDREAKSWFYFAGHPLVIKPHFVKVWEGVPLICMPYCDGDLRGFIEQRLSLTGAVCLSLQIVKGMLVANSRGMAHHQDVKPENLLYIDLSTKFDNFPPPGVDPSVKYSVRIADFGVANAWFDKYRGGTNAYKAPEQHEHDPQKHADAAKLYGAEFAPDIFGVGLVIAELFQGHHPAAPSPDTNVSKWRGSKLKEWATKGERHFTASQDLQTNKLVDLVKQMLDPNPSKRPQFQYCYDQLASILKTLSPKTLEQLELLFSYFDYTSTYCQVEVEIKRQLRLAAIPSQREPVLASIKKNLKDTLEVDNTSLENTLRAHHLSKALQQMHENDCPREDTELLVEASKLIVMFVLKHHKSITADCLYPSFSFGDPKPKKIVSDIEVKAEILNTSIARLQLLDSYDESLERQINNGDKTIEACLIYRDASKAWCEQSLPQACKLLDEVRLLAPHEPELESLYDLWTSTRDHFSK